MTDYEKWKHAIRLMRAGIAEGLRMAAEMFRDSKRVSFNGPVPIDGYDFYRSLISKAKEIEEAAK